jgi:hypothetical protein
MFLDLSDVSFATIVLCRPTKCSRIYLEFGGDTYNQRDT